jgi:diadenylate cyclase
MPDLTWILSRLDLVAIVDIGLVGLIFYWVLGSIQGTRAVQLLWGIVFLVIAVVLSNLFQMTALSWLFKNSIPALLIAIPVIFQPELRRALERLGRTGGLLNRPAGGWAIPSVARAVDEICQAANTLSERRYGGLIVLEQRTGLQEYADTGVPLDAVVTERTLVTIFSPNTPLHDGAAIIRGDRLVAAGCVLPLSENVPAALGLGTRHRAALGVSEQSDAVAVVISEETGIISVAYNGKVTRNLDQVGLKEMLLKLRQNHREIRGSESPAASRPTVA